MNLILKIIQGPNAGAEIALVEGVNLKLGRSDECDIILADQTLPDVACEIETGPERVAILLPGGGQERLDPLHVKVLGTTALAIGPADSPWGTLIWPDSEEAKIEEAAKIAEEEKRIKDEEKQQRQKLWSRRLQWCILIGLILLIILEFILWFFWPQFNGMMLKTRAWCQEQYNAATGNLPESTQATAPSPSLVDLEMLAERNHLELEKGRVRAHTLKGNVKTRAERLQIIARAYQAQPGIILDLSDDETLKLGATEILVMTNATGLVANAENRQLFLSGTIDSIEHLKRVLEVCESDLTHLEKIDCSQVSLPAPVRANPAPVRAANVSPAPQPAPALKTDDSDLQKQLVKDTQPETAVTSPVDEDQEARISLSTLPVVGVLLHPVPCLILKNGSRVLEGADFQGFTVKKINADAVLLSRDGYTLEWKP